MIALRRVLFWCHLAAGVVAGLVILTMCATGVVLAFQPQVLRFVERDVRTTPPGGGARMGAGTLLERAADTFPDAAPTAVTIASDPARSAAVAFGRARTVYLDPSTGAVLGEGASGWRAFFSLTQDLHRWLALRDAARPAGKAATGAANAAFLGLALTGLYIWWPRLRGIRRASSVALFQRGASGKARDFNWHNVIGVWSALPLIVITATGMVISYRWAGDLVYRLAGTEPPPAPAQERASRAAGRTARAVAGGISAERAAALDRLWAVAERQSPGWEAITLRLPEGGRGPVAFSIEEGRFLNRFARSSLSLDAATGAVVKWEPYAEAGAGRQARSWMRFLHTGESLGLAGQTVAALASLGGVFLTVTGISLALRRLRSWRSRQAGDGSRTPVSNTPTVGGGEDLPAVKGALG